MGWEITAIKKSPQRHRDTELRTVKRRDVTPIGAALRSTRLGGVPTRVSLDRAAAWQKDVVARPTGGAGRNREQKTTEIQPNLTSELSLRVLYFCGFCSLLAATRRRATAVSDLCDSVSLWLICFRGLALFSVFSAL
jgi:hypothetical protein